MPPPIARSLRSISLHLPPLNFITLHYAYFIGVCLFSSIIFWGSSTPARSVNYTDSLFLVVSAMTLAGLNTINLSQLNTFQQTVLFVLILLGSAIWVSIAVVHIRRKAFERKFRSIVEAGRQRRRGRNNLSEAVSSSKPASRSRSGADGPDIRGRASNIERQPSAEENVHLAGGHTIGDERIKTTSDNAADIKTDAERREDDHRDSEVTLPKNPLSIDTSVSRRITFAGPTSPTRERHHGRIFSMQGVGARQNIQNHPLETPPARYLEESTQAKGEDVNAPAFRHSFLASGSVGRNSQFAGLTLAERDRLGGVEYRAVSILAVLVPAYFILWQLFGCIGLGKPYLGSLAVSSRVISKNMISLRPVFVPCYHWLALVPRATFPAIICHVSNQVLYLV